MKGGLISSAIVTLASTVPSTAASEHVHWNREPFHVGVGGDPASSWLSYIEYSAPKRPDGTDGIITSVNVTWNVPDGIPSRSGSNAPGWWYGVQTRAGNGALVQPVLACDYMSSSCRQGTYELFDAVYDWSDGSWQTSRSVALKAGDKVNSWLTCNENECTQYAENSRTGQGVEYPYRLHNRNNDHESVLYFVLEHQPSTCDAYPPNGVTLFENIRVEVDGKAVTPTFKAVQDRPACESRGHVIDSKTIAITWNGGKPPSSSADIVV